MDHRGLGLFADGIFFVFFLTCFVVGYVYVSLALQTIAQKTNTPNGWLAWIPIANIILMLEIAKKPIWWIILFLIPLVNLIMSIVVWMGIAEARRKPSWWGILLVIPIVNLIVPGYLPGLIEPEPRFMGRKSRRPALQRAFKGESSSANAR